MLVVRDASDGLSTVSSGDQAVLGLRLLLGTTDTHGLPLPQMLLILRL